MERTMADATETPMSYGELQLAAVSWNAGLMAFRQPRSMEDRWAPT